MRDFLATPAEMFSSLWKHRELIKAASKREVLGRYRGSMLGLAWSFAHPLFMLAVYTFVFSVVFKARWGQGAESKTEFALLLFAGLLTFNLFAECVTRAPNSIISNSNYVKKVIFPLEILPFITLIAALFHMVISIAVWLIAYTIIYGTPHAAVLMLPILLLPFIFLIMGITWALASLGVYLRDVSQIVTMTTSVLMFITPIFYPITALPEQYRPFLLLNPISPIVEIVRNVLFWGFLPDPVIFLAYTICTSFIAWVGFAWFQKTRKGFADVL